MKDIQDILQDGLQKYDAQKIATALAILYDDFKRYPDSLECNVHDFEQPAGACVLRALQTAVEDNFTEGMIVLFDLARAKHVLERLDPNYCREGSREFFQKLTKMFENNINDVNAALAAFWQLPAGHFVPTHARLETLMDEVNAAFESFEAQEQNQRIGNEVQNHTTVSNYGQRKI